MPVDLKFLLYLISRFLTHFCLHFKSYFLVFQGLELIYYQAAKTEKHENSRYKALFLAQHIAALLQKKVFIFLFQFSSVLVHIARFPLFASVFGRMLQISLFCSFRCQVCFKENSYHNILKSIFAHLNVNWIRNKFHILIIKSTVLLSCL